MRIKHTKPGWSDFWDLYQKINETFRADFSSVIHKENSEVAKIKSLFARLPGSWRSHTRRIGCGIKSNDTHAF